MRFVVSGGVPDPIHHASGSPSEVCHIRGRGGNLYRQMGPRPQEQEGKRRGLKAPSQSALDTAKNKEKDDVSIPL